MLRLTTTLLSIAPIAHGAFIAAPTGFGDWKMTEESIPVWSTHALEPFKIYEDVQLLASLVLCQFAGLRLSWFNNFIIWRNHFDEAYTLCVFRDPKK